MLKPSYFVVSCERCPRMEIYEGEGISGARDAARTDGWKLHRDGTRASRGVCGPCRAKQKER